jgi:hypothetical protein
MIKIIYPSHFGFRRSWRSRSCKMERILDLFLKNLNKKFKYLVLGLPGNYSNSLLSIVIKAATKMFSLEQSSDDPALNNFYLYKAYHKQFAAHVAHLIAPETYTAMS